MDVGRLANKKTWRTWSEQSGLRREDVGVERRRQGLAAGGHSTPGVGMAAVETGSGGHVSLLGGGHNPRGLVDHGNGLAAGESRVPLVTRLQHTARSRLSFPAKCATFCSLFFFPLRGHIFALSGKEQNTTWWEVFTWNRIRWLNHFTSKFKLIKSKMTLKLHATFFCSLC